LKNGGWKKELRGIKMDLIKRYSIFTLNVDTRNQIGMMEDDNGNWVKYEDVIEILLRLEQDLKKLSKKRNQEL